MCYKLKILLSLVLLVSSSSCKRNAYLFSKGQQNAFVEIDDMSNIVTFAEYQIEGDCFPNNSIVTLECDGGVVYSSQCVSGRYVVPGVSFSTLPATCIANLEDQNGDSYTSQGTTGEREATFLVGVMEFLDYDYSTGTYRFKNSSRVSDYNSIISSSWEITSTAYDVNGYNGASLTTGDTEIFSFQAATYDLAIPTALNATCNHANSIYANTGGSEGTTGTMIIEKLRINGADYLVNEVVATRSGVWSVDTSKEVSLESTISSALSTEGISSSSINVTLTLLSGHPQASIQANDVQAIENGSTFKFPEILIYYNYDMNPDSLDTAGFVPLAINAGGKSVCSEDVNIIAGSPHDFNLRLTTTDNLGNTVTTQSLFWLRNNYLGVLVPGAELEHTGTTININDSSVTLLDSEYPESEFSDFYLDIDLDGTNDYTETSLPGFVHDYVSSGNYSGVYSVDDSDYWGVGSGEVFSEYVINIP